MSAAGRSRFAVRLTPRADGDRIDGVVDGALWVRVAAAPVDDAANRSLLRLLARALGVSPGRLQLVGGRRGRTKLVEAEGLDLPELRARWPGLGV
jgi:uncharacterized protein YggU (UPF0235/DUF167 family)